MAVLDGTGTLQQVDPPQDIYRHPRTLFVAQFVGELNNTTVRLERDEQGWWLPLGNDRLLLEPALVAQRPGLKEYLGRGVVVGIRPEHLTVAEPGAPFTSCLHGTVDRVEDVGSFAMAWIDVGPWRVKARLAADRLPVPGNRIELAVDRRHIHFFDPVGGLAVS